MRNCIINNGTVTPLHLSDPFFINLTVRLLDCPDNPPPLVSSYHNLKNLTREQFSNMVSSSLPSNVPFSSLHPCTATDTLYSTLSVCLNSACPLTSRPSSKPCYPWLTNTIREARRALRSAERRWHKSHSMDDLRQFHKLLTNFTDQITSAKIMFYRQKIDNAKDSRQLFSTFKSLLHPNLFHPPPPWLRMTLHPSS